MIDDRDIRAAELALGLLEPEEAYRLERMLKQDDDLRQEFELWEDSLAGFLDEAQPMAPTRNVLGDVQRSLFGEQQVRRRAERRFPWGKFVLGVVAFKVVLVSAFFYTRAASTETFRVDTQFGQSTLNWNARTGQVQLSGSGSGGLHLWLRSGNGFSYIGRAGETIAAGLAAGAVLIISADGAGSAAPGALQTITLERD